MSCTIHANHDHVHGTGCGHTAIRHGDHVDYLHDGHLHHVHGDHVDEHILEVSEQNPAECNQAHHCTGHVHGEGCGHEAGHMATTFAISWTDVCTISMATTAMTTVR
ncbi:Uncharacterised protein [Moraxella caprae]|uniref:Threonine dehydratase n=1 Tax=Moraxella caprae TaxID=90240 RepID=A0A378R498_9GAMM|nr:hypothetical protein [Moraxella caprae]STZ09497.1 Uncharacterised protein [Moraxella caprae]